MDIKRIQTDDVYKRSLILTMNLYLLNNGYRRQVEFDASVEELLECWGFIKNIKNICYL